MGFDLLLCKRVAIYSSRVEHSAIEIGSRASRQGSNILSTEATLAVALLIVSDSYDITHSHGSARVF